MDKASGSRAEDPGFDSSLRVGDFSGSSHTRDLKTWHYSGYPARRLRYRVGTGTKFDLQLLSQCDSTYTCLSRSVPEIHLHVAGTLCNQPANQPTNCTAAVNTDMSNDGMKKSVRIHKIQSSTTLAQVCVTDATERNSKTVMQIVWHGHVTRTACRDGGPETTNCSLEWWFGTPGLL